MPYRLHYICFIFLSLALSGCQLALPAPTSIAPVTATAQASEPKVPASESRRQHIIELLHAGHDALRNGRFTTPDDDNAYLRYSQVLNLEPENSEALLGLSGIVEAYLQLAISQAGKGKRHSAKDFVSKARSVDPHHASISAIASMIDEQPHSQRVDYLLPETSLQALAAVNRALAAADPESQVPAPQSTGYPTTQAALATVAVLQKVARHIEQADAAIIIGASSDALGRQIYQYLNQVTSKRIRAQFEISNQTRVSLDVR